jgi:anaerobic magnesium-protoporphyrin IX monomethyl ester cyclase
MTIQLYLVNPPARRGYTHERAQSGGIGVARKRKLFEPEFLEVLPHDFLYQAAVAEQDGHHVQFIDLPLEHIYDHDQAVAFTRATIERGQSIAPGTVIWIGVRLSMPTLRSDVRMANLLKEAFPAARVYAFGNVLMTTYRHWIADAKFDYLFYGEPEAILAEALSAVDPATVRGVIVVSTYAVPDGTDLFDITSTADYRNWRKVSDISKLPRAAWHLLELTRYSTTGRLSDVGLAVPASRGCFMPCTMCAYSLLEGRQMRFRMPQDVLDEIEYLYRTYGIRHIRFRDPNFSANKAHLQEIAQGLIDRHLPIEASAELSLELLDRDLLELMVRSGFRSILTGVESNDEEIMRSIGQNVKISRILEDKVAIAKELGLKVYTFFMVGAPEETWHTVKDTFRFARSLGTESTMTTMTPFPGTAMYWRALYEGLLVSGRRMRYEDWNSYTATMRTYQMSVTEVRVARTWARLETYIPYIWNQSKDASFGDRLRAAAHLAPRVAWLAALRPYAAWKLHCEKTNRAPRPERVNIVAGRGLIPIPMMVAAHELNATIERDSAEIQAREVTLA